MWVTRDRCRAHPMKQGNTYEWIISMEKDLINEYLHVHYGTPQNCNVFEISSEANLTSLDFNY